MKDLGDPSYQAPDIVYTTLERWVDAVFGFSTMTRSPALGLRGRVPNWSLENVPWPLNRAEKCSMNRRITDADDRGACIACPVPVPSGQLKPRPAQFLGTSDPN